MGWSPVSMCAYMLWIKMWGKGRGGKVSNGLAMPHGATQKISFLLPPLTCPSQHGKWSTHMPTEVCWSFSWSGSMTRGRWWYLEDREAHDGENTSRHWSGSSSPVILLPKLTDNSALKSRTSEVFGSYCLKGHTFSKQKTSAASHAPHQ